MSNSLNNRGGIDKGSVYVVVIMISLIFAGYILVGGTLPTKLPKVNYNLVSIIMPPKQPTTSSLQMNTFYGVTLTPRPTRPSTPPTDSPFNPKLITCGYQSTSPKAKPMVWGYTIDSTPASANTFALKVFYTNKFALSFGSGAISQMTKHPTDHITNPIIGNGGPAVFLTDITIDTTSKLGDAEEGGLANIPSDVYGTWKANGAINPAPNNRELGSTDEWPPSNGPPGGHDLDFSSEIIWRLLNMRAIDPISRNYLTLQPGHTYRGEIILHDGEKPDNMQRTCITFKIPTTDTNDGKNTNVKITFYGSYDNDPKGSLDIAHPVIHQKAGGIGTYQDPLTFASPEGNGEYPWGTIIYVPLVQKYFIREDECAESWTAPNGCGPVNMVDLYVGNPSSDEAVVECENSLTPSGNSPIIIDPPSNLPYDPTPIWNQSTGQCMTPH